MKIKQQISISGRNWNDIVQLSCFRALKKVDVLYVLVGADYVDGQRLGYEDSYYSTRANIGDTLIEHADGSWEVRHNNEKQE